MLGTLFIKYVTGIAAWADWRIISIMIASPVFGFLVGVPHYRVSCQRFLLFRLSVYPLLQLYVGLLFLGAILGICVASIHVMRTGIEYLSSVPMQITETTAWTVGLASMSAWFLLLWLLAVISHIAHFALGRQSVEEEQSV